MKQSNLRIEGNITEVLLSFSERTGEDATLDSAALEIAKICQEHEEEELSELIDRASKQMAAVLGLDLLDARMRRARRKGRRKLRSKDSRKVEKKQMPLLKLVELSPSAQEPGQPDLESSSGSMEANE
jgi:hypothetical protein